MVALTQNRAPPAGKGSPGADLQLGADSVVDGQVDDMDARRRQAVLQNALKLVHLHMPTPGLAAHPVALHPSDNVQ